MPILVSAFGPKALSLAARACDGFVTTQPDPDALASYRSQGGRGPSSACAKVCYGPSREDSVKTVHRPWANAGVPGELALVLPSPKHFEQIGGLSQDFFDVYAAEVLPALREVGS